MREGGGEAHRQYVLFHLLLPPTATDLLSLWVADTHPLLTQVQTRLTALRDRELSSIEARHVVARKESGLVEQADVGAIWEWWRNGREELQRDMMADVMRKRRRVDREKRAVEGGRREFFLSCSRLRDVRDC